jgi:hypothetical protein
VTGVLAPSWLAGDLTGLGSIETGLGTFGKR